MLRKVGFVVVDKVGNASMVSVNAACCTGLPHAADVIMGTLVVAAVLPLRPAQPTSPSGRSPTTTSTGCWHLRRGHRDPQRDLRDEAPDREELQARWLPDLAWVADLDDQVVGWTAVMPVSGRECYSGVGETTVYVAEAARGRGVGKALLHTQVNAADAAGLWTLQTSIFPENRASLALHRSAGYRTLAVRSRIARLDGVWRDTVLMERRSERA